MIMNMNIFKIKTSFKTMSKISMTRIFSLLIQSQMLSWGKKMINCKEV